MEYDVRFCTSADGTRIAYGMGQHARERQPPLVALYYWLVPMEVATTEGLPLVGGGTGIVQPSIQRIDRRGLGHSQREVTDVSVERQIEDVEAVANDLGAPVIDLLGYGDGATVAAAFAGRHPTRVRRLALGMLLRPESQETWSAMSALTRANWPLARRALYDLFFGDVDQERRRWYIERLDRLVSQQVAAQYADMFGQNELPVPLLANIEAQTVVVHSSRRRGESAALAGALSAAIPRAKLVTTEFSEYQSEYADLTLRFVQGETKGTSPTVPSGTAIILFADIVDSTALTERMGDSAFRAKARDLDASLRKIIAEAGGATVEGKLLGDGVLATFPAASQAIDAALRCGIAGTDGGLPLHVGLHAGDVIREQNNVFGGAVNIASRISALSAPGEVLVSRTVADLARTSAGVTFEDRGEHALKGVGDAVRVYAVRKESA